MTASARSLATAYGASAPAPDVSLGDDGIERSRDPSASVSPVPVSWKSGMSPFQRASELETNATCVPSGDHDGTLIVPCPPYTYANVFGGALPSAGMMRIMQFL